MIADVEMIEGQFERFDEFGVPVSKVERAAIDVQVNRLRRKIERDPKSPRYLQTVRGQGYILRPD